MASGLCPFWKFRQLNRLKVWVVFKSLKFLIKMKSVIYKFLFKRLERKTVRIILFLFALLILAAILSFIWLRPYMVPLVIKLNPN